MISLSTFSRAGVAAVLLLLAGIFLAVPNVTYDPSDQNAAVSAQIAGASAMPGAPAKPGAPAVLLDDASPAAHRVAAGPRRSDQPPARQRPGMAGMVVGIDPETGELGMPTPEQMRVLSDSPQYQVDHSAAGLVEVHHPDGSVSVDLQGRFQEYATVRIGPDGKLIFRCVDGEENAKRSVEAPAPPALEER